MRRLFVLGLVLGCSSAVSPAGSRLTGAEIAGWGDSLTQDNGDRGDYLADVSELLLRPVFNGGVSGQTSSQILSRFLADSARRSDVTIFWMGRNNFADTATVAADIARAVTNVHGVRYLVLSILNGDYPGERKDGPAYATIARLNAQLATTYADHFLDIRQLLVAQFDSTNALDVENHAADVPPSTLRFDGLHLNAEGNRRVAQAVATRLRERGW